MKTADEHGQQAGALVSVAEMRALEAAAMAAGTPEESLMAEAGAGLARVALTLVPGPGHAVIFAGKGHNAGDAFVMAADLIAAGWHCEVRAVWPEEAWRPLTRRMHAAVAESLTLVPLDAPPAEPPTLIVDGLLGIGAAGPLEGGMRAACRALNALREATGAPVLAVDLPSGLDADSGEADPDAVIADVTVTLGHPKTGLCAPGAEHHVGRLAVVPLTAAPLPPYCEDRAVVLTPPLLRSWLPGPRGFGMHKGQAGRAGILAGSRGLTGAARLASTAASLAGAGLVTLFCPDDVWPVLATACPPEVMVRGVRSCREIMEANLDAVAAGPGLGPAPVPDLLTLLRDDPRPMLLDADALNAASALPDGARLWPAAGPRLLTPHPGEMARLLARFAPDLSGKPPAVQAQELAARTGAVVLLKGARSCIAAPGLPVLFNASGHPAMARGGMGDVLAGLAVAFMAGGMEPRRAAALASWLIGAGAESWLRRHGNAVEALTASAVLRHACLRALPALRAGLAV